MTYGRKFLACIFIIFIIGSLVGGGQGLPISRSEKIRQLLERLFGNNNRNSQNRQDRFGLFSAATNDFRNNNK